MNKRQLQQAAIDLVVAILAGYIMLMAAPLPVPHSAPVDDAPRLLRVQALTAQSAIA